MDKTRQYLLKELREVQEEIQQVQLQLEQQSRPVANVDQIMHQLLAMSDRALAARKQRTDVDDGREDQTSTLQQLQTLASMTGLHFTDAMNTLRPETQQRDYHLEGSSETLGFSMDLVVSETTLVVETLKVEVYAPSTLELSAFLESVEQSRSPHDFFRGFVQYAELNEERRQLFEWMEAEFSGYISLPNGSSCAQTAIILSPTDSSLGFVLSWKISIREAAMLSCDIRLLPIVSQAWNTSDPTGLVQQTNKQFRSIWKMRGLQDAIRMFAGIVAGPAALGAE
eukprot:m.48300 g.48300  ORF g.48300 m.48300 type:complete len:283 (-) comp47704_c0_seq2:46-894(-)